METPIGRPFPSWVVFDKYIYRKDPDSFPEDDAETPSAAARASNGDPILVSFRLLAPPEASHLYLHYPPEAEEFNETAVVAADGDSVLFRVVAPPSGPVDPSFSWCCHTDYFVCKAGGSSGLSLSGPLPPCYVDEWQMAGQGRAVHSHMLRARDIGLLRRGEEEFAVADLMMLVPDDTDAAPVEAELFRYRSHAGSHQWEIKRLPILSCSAGLHQWTTDAVIPFDRYLCWIDYYRGILFCDVLNDDPVLRFAKLPVKPPEGNRNQLEPGRRHPFVTRSLCVTKCGIMKFVNISRADGEIASKRKSGSGFTMDSYYLATPLSFERIQWVIDGTVDARHLWRQHLYAKLGIPHLSPEFPFVSLDKPHIVYAVLREAYGAARNSWVLVIDMNRAELLSAIPHNERIEFWKEAASLNFFRNKPVLPSLFSMYLNKHAYSCDGPVEGTFVQSDKTIEPSLHICGGSWVSHVRVGGE
ncbi:hypothetical protein ACP70R_039577 [Stipagrostis hirtigluma subsp. patula]